MFTTVILILSTPKLQIYCSGINALATIKHPLLWAMQVDDQKSPSCHHVLFFLEVASSPTTSGNIEILQPSSLLIPYSCWRAILVEGIHTHVIFGCQKYAWKDSQPSTFIRECSCPRLSLANTTIICATQVTNILILYSPSIIHFRKKPLQTIWAPAVTYLIDILLHDKVCISRHGFSF